MRNFILTLTLLQCALSGFSQQMYFGILPYGLSIDKEKVSEAKLISDIDPRFPESWIKEYVSVDLSVGCNGDVVTAEGSSLEFNDTQLQLLNTGETGADIEVVVHYYPDNNFTKEIKELDFVYKIAPEQEAEFQGGEEKLREYLKESAIDQIDEDTKADIHQVKVRFVVEANGEVSGARLHQISGIKSIDNLLLASVKNMPKWNPAIGSDGSFVSQELEFIVSNSICTTPTLYADK